MKSNQQLKAHTTRVYICLWKCTDVLLEYYRYQLTETPNSSKSSPNILLTERTSVIFSSSLNGSFPYFIFILLLRGQMTLIWKNGFYVKKNIFILNYMYVYATEMSNAIRFPQVDHTLGHNLWKESSDNLQSIYDYMTGKSADAYSNVFIFSYITYSIIYKLVPLYPRKPRALTTWQFQLLGKYIEFCSVLRLLAQKYWPMNSLFTNSSNYTLSIQLIWHNSCFPDKSRENDDQHGLVTSLW